MQGTLEPSLNLQIEDVYCHHVKIGGSRRRKLIARHLSVRSRKPITVQLFLSEAVSQGQWMHSISSPPSNIWFNRERRGPQTELWESTAAMWSGCKHRHEVEERDYKQVWSPWGCPDRLTGEGEGGKGGWWFGLLLFAPLPSTTFLLPAALSFTLSGCKRESGIDRSTARKRETDKQQTDPPGGWSPGKQLRPTNLLTAQFPIES